MRNFDRAMAYATQRGVESLATDALQFYSAMKKDALRDMMLVQDVDHPRDATKQALVEIMVMRQISPHLTPTQLKRIRQHQDSSRTLRDRKGRKRERRIRRHQWLGRA